MKNNRLATVPQWNFICNASQHLWGRPRGPPAWLSWVIFRCRHPTGHPESQAEINSYGATDRNVLSGTEHEGLKR